MWRAFQIAIVLLVIWAVQTFDPQDARNPLVGPVLGIIAAGFATLIVSAALDRVTKRRRQAP